MAFEKRGDQLIQLAILTTLVCITMFACKPVANQQSGTNYITPNFSSETRKNLAVIWGDHGAKSKSSSRYLNGVDADVTGMSHFTNSILGMKTLVLVDKKWNDIILEITAEIKQLDDSSSRNNLLRKWRRRIESLN